MYTDGFVQERCNSIANALDLHLSCTNPSLHRLNTEVFIMGNTQWYNQHLFICTKKFISTLSHILWYSCKTAPSKHQHIIVTSNHHQPDWLLNSPTTKKISTFHITGPLWWVSPHPVYSFHQGPVMWKAFCMPWDYHEILITQWPLQSCCETAKFVDIWKPGAGPRFTNVFSIAIQIRWKLRFALISIPIQWSLQNFVHGMTAVLSWHVQQFVVIWWPVTELQQGEVSSEFELRAKNR